MVRKTQRLEDTIVKTNVDAIKEIVRSIRLRDLGGIIIIDFIDMDERRNRQRVMHALEEELRHDRRSSLISTEQASDLRQGWANRPPIFFLLQL